MGDFCYVFLYQDASGIVHPQSIMHIDILGCYPTSSLDKVILIIFKLQNHPCIPGVNSNYLTNIRSIIPNKVMVPFSSKWTRKICSICFESQNREFITGNLIIHLCIHCPNVHHKKHFQMSAHLCNWSSQCKARLN